MGEFAYLRCLVTAFLARLSDDERGVMTTEGVIVVAALVLLAVAVTAIIAAKVLAKANSIQL